MRVHPFPFRTRQLSSSTPKILCRRRHGKIGRCQHPYSSLAQLVEHAAVNRRVVGSSPTGGAIKKDLHFASPFYFSFLLKRIFPRITSMRTFFPCLTRPLRWQRKERCRLTKEKECCETNLFVSKTTVSFIWGVLVRVGLGEPYE